MKIGFNMLLWATHVTEEHFGLFERLKKTGFDGVEVPVFEGDPAHFEKVSQVLKDNGLASTTVSVIPDEQHNPISADPNHRQGGLDYLKWLIDCTSALESDLICGPLYQPLGVFSGSGATDEEKSRAVQVHRAAADYAAASGISLAVEPLNRFEAYFLNTMADAAAHVKAVGKDNFGILYDTFHANIEEKDPVGCISEYIDSIKHVHISENDRGTPGSGHIDWTGTFAALRSSGYDGWLTIEAFGQALPDLAAATRVWRDFFAKPDDPYVVGFNFVKQQWAKAG
jgi:D-psicose/D-tagatose/L-ribulose 3-epimerase